MTRRALGSSSWGEFMQLGALVRTAAACLVALSLASCSSSSEASSVTYSLNFPSIAAATATQSVKIVVFDATTPDVCQTVFLKTVNGDGTNLPSILVDGREIPLCDLIANPSLGQFSTSYGHRAILAIGIRSTSTTPKENFLVGCTEVELSQATTDVNIPMTLPDQNRQPPAPTTCTSLTQSCAKKCP